MQALRNTAEISVWVTVLALALGYPLAYLMAVVSERVRTLLIVLVLVPFWTSVLVRTFAWMVILGKRGIINQLLPGWGVVDRPLALIYNMLGRADRHGPRAPAVHGVPAPERHDPDRWDAGDRGPQPRRHRRGRPSSASSCRSSLPGVSAGCVLVFLLAVGFYITPALLGGEGQVTFATLIELVVRDLLDWNFGASLGVFLLTVVGDAVRALQHAARPGAPDRGQPRVIEPRRSARPPAPVDVRRPDALLFLCAPIAIVVVVSFNASEFIQFPPRAWSLRWYAELFRLVPVGAADAAVASHRLRHHAARRPCSGRRRPSA